MNDEEESEIHKDETCEKLYKDLIAKGITCAYYHGGMGKNERNIS